MDTNWIHYYLWITVFYGICKGCTFYSRSGLKSESDGVRFIRVREDLPVGEEVLTLRAYPRNSILLKGTERSTDYHFFRINEINSTTVQVVLNKSLDNLVDRDVPQNLLKFKLQCSSVIKRTEETAFLSVTVYIEDINDNYPKFQNLPYFITVDETTPIGTTLFQKLHAFDRDKPNTPNSDVQYTLGAHDFDAAGPYFALESPHKPTLILRRPLDFDAGIRNFKININAFDRGTPPKVSNTTMTILVNDVDDLPPKFSEPVYRTKINEFHPFTDQIVHVPLYFDPPIQAFDQDSFNTSLKFEIISGNERNLFRVRRGPQVLYLEREIDLEEEVLLANTFVLQLEASQIDNPSQRALSRIEIEILDLNDNPPEFEVDLYNISIVENLPSGFSVLQVNAIDRDQKENSEFYYDVIHEYPNGVFSVDSQTGWITVKDQNLLDREKRTSFQMEIRAVEKVPPYSSRDKTTGTVHVEVSLLDANDNTPQFEFGNLYEFKVDANAKIGQVVGHVKATDPDEGLNGMIMYELQRPPGPNLKSHLPFKLDSVTGALVVSDQVQKGRIAFFIEASDQPSNPSERRFSLAVVTVDVVQHLDEGEIEFLGAPYEFWIGSDASIGASVGQVKINMDWESNEEIMFDLLHSYTEGVPFAVEERSGIVTVIRPLDDFTRQHYEFEAVVAFINNPTENSTYYTDENFRQTKMNRLRKSESSFERDLTSPSSDLNFDNVMVTNMSIHIVDSSDGKKIFVRGSNNDSIVFHIKENLPNVLIGQLLTKNATNTDNQFEHNNIDTPRSQRQMMASTRFRTNGTKYGRSRPKRAGEPTELVDLQGEEAKYVRKKVIRRMKALDIDNEKAKEYTANDPNMELRFLIANQQDVMDLIRITNDGSLMTVQGLDREIASTYRLTVIAEYSKGFYAGAGIYQVTIHVDDVNDNAPTFNRNAYKGIIAENSLLGTEVLMNHVIKITDNDAGANGDFTVALRGEGSAFFVLEKVNKTKSLKSKADLNKLYHKYNIEKNIVNSNIMFYDSNEQIEEGPYYVLRFTGPSVLDRERDNFYDLNIIATDSGNLSSEASLSILILDVNDNAPMFEKIAVFKHSGIEILQFTGVMEIYYVDMMNDNSNNVESRNTETDFIKFDNLSKSSETTKETIYKLDDIPPTAGFSATAVGTPRKLEDVLTRKHNAKALKEKFNKEEYPLFAILENIAVGVPVVKVTATDEDSDSNSQVFYAIESEFFIPNKAMPRQMNTIKYFSIDRLSGEVKINRPLPAESEIRLNISAKDIGGLSDATIIRFKVIDINDHPPIFKKVWHTFDVEEGVYSKMNLGKIEATDEDYGNNANITYSIHSTDKVPFEIVYLSGDLKVTGILDREKKSVYEFKIIASDNSDRYMKLTAVAEVEVNVLDLNDNAPEYTGYDELYVSEDLDGGDGKGRKLSNVEDLDSNYHDKNLPKLPVYKAYLNRRTEPGTLVKQITALDKDFAGNGNGLVMYALEHIKMPYVFEVDSRTGVITTASRLNMFNDYEHINLTVVASDLGSPSLSSTAMILINLQGENVYEDNEPAASSMFLHKYFEVEVLENNPAPMRLLRINMSTGMTDEKYRWHIVPEMEILKNDEFRVDVNNGTIWLVKPLDREKKDIYKLKVRAEKVSRESRNIPIMMYPIVGERVNGLLDNEVRVVVRVLDVNDNTPKFKSQGQPIVTVIPHNANFGYPVTQVEATDADVGINADIRYTLLNEPSKIFGIDPTNGKIRVIGTLPNSNQRVYGFDVKANDRKGADDGRSTIVNVFVYVLDSARQVRLVLSGSPVEVEKRIDELTKVLSEATGLDVRVRMIEPHSSENEQSTDVYLYAVDPKTNSVLDMEELQETMSSLNMHNLPIAVPILDLPQLGTPRGINRSPYLSHAGNLSGPELASIILAVTIFAAGLATAFCIVCIRYKRNKENHLADGRRSQLGLAYAISAVSRVPSSLPGQKKTMFDKTMSSAASTSKPPRKMIGQNIYGKHQSRDREREYMDVPLPQAVLSSNYNVVDHDQSCVHFNQLHKSHHYINGDGFDITSSKDSGFDTHQPSRSSTNSKDKLIRQRCACQKCSITELSGESSDSYEDSLKDLRIAARKNSQPLPIPFQREPTPARTVRHSFSGNRDDVLLSQSMSYVNRNKYNEIRKSLPDLDRRLKNIERSFKLNNSRC